MGITQAGQDYGKGDVGSIRVALQSLGQVEERVRGRGAPPGSCKRGGFFAGVAQKVCKKSGEIFNVMP